MARKLHEDQREHDCLMALMRVAFIAGMRSAAGVLDNVLAGSTDVLACQIAIEHQADELSKL